MIAETIESLKNEVETTCLKTGRKSNDVTIVLITKTVAIEQILETYNAGVRHFGENKVQELLAKVPKLPNDINWHFVGYLQTNKVKYIVDKVTLIHSLDRLKLAQEIEKQAIAHSRIVNVLLQVHLTNEETKSGIKEEELDALIKGVQSLSHIKIRGLMTIGPFSDDGNTIRTVFKKLFTIREGLKRTFSDIDFSILSMGMSADYSIALEEGANMLRIGSAVFGERA
ncbi:MAG: YggS family pyridoxal phosphate-dependent enzyme [Candidatus Omnitrophica bacterium]|nr:YggS family pyridoxal phosphate-dependent enzyme [Candidatus Omnitrophota bacterium]